MALRSCRLTSLAQPARTLSKAATAQLSSSSNGDYLHETILPMHHFQRSLPRLPIPKLEDSCERYLSAQKPLLSAEDHSCHKQLVDSFAKGVGLDLHKELVAQDRKNKHTSYITDYWFDMYLKARTPLPLNYNPFIAFVDDTNPGGDNQIIRAATLLSSSVRFLRTYRDKKLQPELFHLNAKATDNDRIKKRLGFFPEAVSWYGAYLHKVFPLDMSQYGRLFNTTRVPREGKDELVTYDGRRHVAVLAKGKLYSFNILNEDGSAVPVETIYACLKEIESRSQGSESVESIACLTTDDRDKWAAARQSLVAHPENAENLEMVDSAVLMLCLEDSSPNTVVDLSTLFLHGKAHSKWFDKSVQLIVCPGGKAALNFEHAWGDGVAVLRYLSEVYDDVKKHPFTPPTGTTDTPAVRDLNFVLDDGLRKAISSAKKRFDEHTGSLRMSTIQYPGMNKAFLKKKKLSADAILQFSLQLAFFRQYGYTPATYESCSTAAFKHGRTETVRPATLETAACVAAFESKADNGPAQLREFIDRASQKHTNLIKEAATGKGFDRHLFAMKQIAAASGKKVELFESQQYADINHIVLSTSTLSSPAVLLGGFAPVVPDGFGVGYRVDDNFIGSQVTAYDGHKDTEGFVSALESALKDIQSVFEAE